MIGFCIRRIVAGVLVLWVVVTLVFLLNYSIPQDPAKLFAGHQATAATIASVRRSLYLDKPLWVQYGHFWDQVIHGQLTSYVSHSSVVAIISAALPATVSLMFGGAIIWLAMGLGIGILAARRPRSWIDRSATVFSLFFYSMPTFVIGVFLLYVFFYQARLHGIAIVPAAGYQPLGGGILPWAHALVLPWITLALGNAATYSRLTRSSLLEVLGEDYIRTARAKGISERRVVYRHGMRSAVTPLISQFGVDAATVFGSVVITEIVFGLNGIGKLAVRSITVTHDLPVVMGIVLIAAAFIVISNVVVDVLYAVLDRRVRVN